MINRTWRLGAIGLALTIGLSACAFQAKAFDPAQTADLRARLAKAPSHPQTHFMVFSDPHLVDPATMGATGPAFDKVLETDHKLYRESAEILDAVLADILAKKPAFVLVPGDLTKDGELVAHQTMAARLHKLVASGIKVLVVPGNHDIWDARAARFEGDQVIPVAQTAPEEFALLYRECGYGEAIARDSSSLSYLAEPVPGLWLFALDSVQYEDSKVQGRPQTAGRIRQSTVTWMEPLLRQAQVEGKAVLVMQHHGLLPHVPGLEWAAPQYLVANWRPMAKFLASYGVRYVFTGHLHSNDVAAFRWNNSLMLDQAAYDQTLFDIETGSLVTYPVPYRDCVLETDGRLTIHTLHVTTIPSLAAQGISLIDRSRQFIREAVERIVKTRLKDSVIPVEDQTKALPLIQNWVLGHYQGDEKPTPENKAHPAELSLASGIALMIVRQITDGLREDSFPPDNDVELSPNGRARALDPPKGL